MKPTSVKTGRALGLRLLATGGAMAEKPEWAGGAKSGQEDYCIDMRNSRVASFEPDAQQLY